MRTLALKVTNPGKWSRGPAHWPGRPEIIGCHAENLGRDAVVAALVSTALFAGFIGKVGVDGVSHAEAYWNLYLMTCFIGSTAGWTSTLGFARLSKLYTELKLRAPNDLAAVEEITTLLVSLKWWVYLMVYIAAFAAVFAPFLLVFNLFPGAWRWTAVVVWGLAFAALVWMQGLSENAKYTMRRNFRHYRVGHDDIKVTRNFSNGRLRKENMELISRLPACLFAMGEKETSAAFRQLHIDSVHQGSNDMTQGLRALRHFAHDKVSAGLTDEDSLDLEKGAIHGGSIDL
ncbi:hypothetical protein WJX73_001516 [Symbiochloris irregularis]|uniref:Uncharacterized protein n=1 Tax=Symbiochloris irregularis TaxID=706552 RepID=A0AAW1PJD0_9CHLO